MKMNMKISALFFVLFVSIIMVQGASALQYQSIEVEMDGIKLSESSETIVAFDRNDEFEVRVIFALNGTEGQVFENVQVEARVRGYRYADSIGDISRAFNVHANTIHHQRLNIKTPIRMDPGAYKLRITVTDAFGKEVSKTYDLRIVEQRSGMWIRDIIFNPSNSVQAGRALLASVRVRNIGEVDQRHGVRVNVEIPELHISATDYIDEIRRDETITSEELYLRIPNCAEPGTYNAVIEIIYEDGDERLVAYKPIDVTKGEFCDVITPEEEPKKEYEKPAIVVTTEVHEIMQGVGGAIYPVSIKNKDTSSRTFTLLVDAESWAKVRISPSNTLILQPGETKTAYVYVSAKSDARLGQNLFALTVTSDKFTEQFTLMANVVESDETTSWTSLKGVLEIGLVVLVILLVILGLVIGLKKMKKDDKEGDDAQSYY